MKCIYFSFFLFFSSFLIDMTRKNTPFHQQQQKKKSKFPSRIVCLCVCLLYASACVCIFGRCCLFFVNFYTRFWILISLYMNHFFFSSSLSNYKHKSDEISYTHMHLFSFLSSLFYRLVTYTHTERNTNIHNFGCFFLSLILSYTLFLPVLFVNKQI